MGWSNMSLVTEEIYYLVAEVSSHLALVQKTDDLLEKPLFELLLGPLMLSITWDQMWSTGFVGPLREQINF